MKNISPLLYVFCITLSITPSLNAHTILVFGGKTGWIGKKIVALLQETGHTAICAASRLENREQISNEIDTINPDMIINAAGITGRPNVDWCETHRQETIRTNVLGTTNLIDIAYLKGIHVTNISTGCIYEYDEKHPKGSGIGFTEEEEPNFDGSFYSRNKILLEKLILEYPNVLNLRVKMPLSTDLEHGFVAKIIKYPNIIQGIPNSLCVLDDLLPIAIDMTCKKITGNFNFVNPGAISHGEVLTLYKKIVDPTHTWNYFSVEEQDQQLKARRANAELSAQKLLALYPDIPPIKDSLPKIMNIIARQQKGTNE